MFSRLHNLLCYLALAPLMLRWRRLLRRNADVLAEADAVVVMSSPRAFGTLFASLDEARRLFAGKRLVFLYHLERAGQNPLLGEAFEDVAVIAAPRRRWDLVLLGKRLELPPDDWHDPMSFWMTARWVARRGRPGAEVLNAFQLWRRLPVSEAAEKVFPRVETRPANRSRSPFRGYGKVETAFEPGELDVLNELHMYGGWNTIRARTPAPPMRLPERHAAPIRRALEAARNGRAAKLCGFHTRYGGEADKIFRDGAPLEFYIPAIRRLVAAGYQVLMQGDRTFHPRFRDTFGGMVVDADSLGAEKNAFRLFCGCHTDLFVGDWPVAPQMAAANGIRTLVVNAWPVGWAVNGAEVAYRRVVDGEGRSLPLEEALRLGALISCNTVPHLQAALYRGTGVTPEAIGAFGQAALAEEEITAVVQSFLEDVEAAAPPTETQHRMAALLPVWSPFAMAQGARLNRAWLSLYDAAGPDREARPATPYIVRAE